MLAVRARLFDHCRKIAAVGDIHPTRQQKRRQRVAEGLQIDINNINGLNEVERRHVIPSVGKMIQIKAGLAEAKKEGIKQLKIKRGFCQYREKERMSVSKKAILTRDSMYEMAVSDKTVTLKNLVGDQIEIEKKNSEVVAKKRALLMVQNADAAGLFGVFVTLTNAKRATADFTPADISKVMTAEWNKLGRRSSEVGRFTKRCPQADGTPHDHSAFYFESDSDANDFADNIKSGWSLGSVKVRKINDGEKLVEYMFSSKNSCQTWSRTWQIKSNNFSRNVAKIDDATVFKFNRSDEARLWRGGQDLAKCWAENGKMPVIWTPAGLVPTISEIRLSVKKPLIIKMCGDRSSSIDNNTPCIHSSSAADVIGYVELPPPVVRPPSMPPATAKKRRPTLRELVKSLTEYVGDKPAAPSACRHPHQRWG